mmetsp:Transcript_29177/g.50405  ORF Transcript_29177/g.50405 Transcript_29177/m.50405 type:complete len:202 (-) Transcript_29177:625-1230(-)
MATAGILTFSVMVGEPSGLLEEASVVSAPPSSSLEVGPLFLRNDKKSLNPGVSGLNGPHSMASVGVAGGGIVTDRDVVVVVVVCMSSRPSSSWQKWLSSRRLFEEEDMVNSSESTSAGVGETITSASILSLPSSSSFVEKLGPCVGVAGASVDGIATVGISVDGVVDDDEAPMLTHSRSSSSSSSSSSSFTASSASVKAAE